MSYLSLTLRKNLQKMKTLMEQLKAALSEGSGDHNHDSIYYRESEVDNYLGLKADVSHHHDDRYYTETEMDTALGLKANTDHNHDASYSSISHNHDSNYASISHNHDGTYSLTSHNHDGTYSLTSHNHDATYATIGHTHPLYLDVDDIDKRINLFDPYLGNGFVRASRGWSVANSDADAYLKFTFKIPQTRSDWKIRITSYNSTGSRTCSGIISLGAVTVNPATTPWNETNIFNAVNLDLAFTYNDRWYHDTSSQFTAELGQEAILTWAKDNDAGTGTLVIGSVSLIHD